MGSACFYSEALGVWMALGAVGPSVGLHNYQVCILHPNPRNARVCDVIISSCNGILHRGSLCGYVRAFSFSVSYYFLEFMSESIHSGVT